jgi:hypothetical protein
MDHVNCKGHGDLYRLYFNKRGRYQGADTYRTNYYICDACSTVVLVQQEKLVVITPKKEEVELMTY